MYRRVCAGLIGIAAFLASVGCESTPGGAQHWLEQDVFSPKSSMVVDVPLDTAWNAVWVTTGQLRLAHLRTTKDSYHANLDVLSTDNRNVTIYAESLAPDKTKISVSSGTFGKDYAAKILTSIRANIF
jgi:hypothetical protein